ncbi:MAG: hypothetical protein LLF97_06020 [Planctomycetaceae bacterium]|nr:hypothetical protein [Planctomycetaceae bacterium]
MPAWSATDPITITAQAGNQWEVGSYEVWVLRGDCVIRQGQGLARCREAVLWIDRTGDMTPRQQKVIAYLEGDVKLSWAPSTAGPELTDQTWFGRFWSGAGVNVRAEMLAGKPNEMPPIYGRGMARRNPAAGADGWQGRVTPSQFVGPTTGGGPTAGSTAAPTASGPLPATRPGVMTPVPAPIPQPGEAGAVTSGARRIRVFPRSDVPVQVQWFPDRTGTQWIGTIDSGVNVIVDGLEMKNMGMVGTIDVSADRLVIWTAGTKAPKLEAGEMQDQRVPLEFYLEGNVVFRQGERTIRADRMYYDVPNHVGLVVNADLITPMRNYAGLLRLHADVLQQTAEDRYRGQGAFLTSSRMEEPGYRVQAGDIYFEDLQVPVIDPATGQPQVDPNTGRPIVDRQQLATADGNFVYAGPVPIFYWPRMSFDPEDPTLYIRRAQVRNSNVFGTELLTHWNGYQLLGIRHKPKGTDFDVDLDYLSKRGFGYGGKFTYDRPDFFGFGGPTDGRLNYWGIQDQGTDDLGEQRRNVPLEKDYRYRLLWQHREQLPYDFQLTAEAGLLSDRNFLEEYYKRDWETQKDETTGLELKRIDENRSLSLSADYRVNDFFTETNWLPRLDHFWLGQSVLQDTFTWYEHSNVAYAEFQRTDVPENVSVGSVTGRAGPFNYLPWEVGDRSGERVATRQEIDWPFQLGAVKIVPYAMGELAHWGEDVNGESLDRAWGQLGLRSSLPMWRVDPTFESDLLNVHGIAHKVVFDAEFSIARANRHLDELPLYDALDDNSIEAFRRRFLTTTFGLPSMMLTPTGEAYLPKFDERYYALRSGLQNWVTSPSTEIADDLTALRLGVEQKWQTKRGPISNQQIIDWVTFDTHMTLFPDPDDDNYGTVAGLLDYDFRWHVGDRLTLLSDAIFDFFDQGQKIISVGAFLTRPPRGSLYAGFRIIEGPTELLNEVLSLSYSYRMSPKWMSTFGTSINMGKQPYVGQNFSITRIGESLLISAGFTVDAARKDFGVGFVVEPRFLPKGRLNSTPGVDIPPAGAMGLE